MQEQLSDGPTAVSDTSVNVPGTEEAPPAGVDEPSQRRRRSRRTDWRLGGTTIRRWDGMLLAIAFMCVGAGVVASTAVGTLWTSPWSSTVSLVLLWAGMIVPVALAFRRGIPAGLLRFRPTDLLFGVVLGLALRLVQGWVTDAGSQPVPSVATLDGALSPMWLVTDAIPAALVGPVVEEFFFRTVVLVAVFAVLRRAAGTFAAALAAVLASTATFVLLHAVDGSLPLSEALPIGFVGLVSALLVVLTGRVWGAVLVHVVYNGTMIAIVAAGTILR